MLMLRHLLVLAPHADDAELGCGGTIARMLDDHVKVSVAVFSIARESLPEGAPEDTLLKEFYRSMDVLGLHQGDLAVYDYPVRRLSYHRQEILEDLVALNRDLEPDIVLTPSGADVHQDHQVLYAEAVRAFKRVTLWGYELPWNHTTFAAEAFVVLDKSHIDRKWRAVEAYESQFQLNRPYFTRHFLDGLASVRGCQVGAAYAEAFEAIRTKI